MKCPTCGVENAERAMYCQNCGAAIPSPMPGAAVGVTVQTESYAGFWIRLVAWLIDFVVVGTAIGIVTAITFGAGIVLGFVGHWLYEALMLSSEWQATVGKRAMSIVVTRMDGSRLSFGRATGRYFAKWVSGFLLGVGYIIIAFTEKKQGLHDMMAETVVIVRR